MSPAEIWNNLPIYERIVWWGAAPGEPEKMLKAWERLSIPERVYLTNTLERFKDFAETVERVNAELNTQV